MSKKTSIGWGATDGEISRIDDVADDLGMNRAEFMRNTVLARVRLSEQRASLEDKLAEATQVVNDMTTEILEIARVIDILKGGRDG